MMSHYSEIPIHENNDPMIDLSGYPFAVEPVYFNQGFSTSNTGWMRKSLADTLLNIQESELGNKRFKIWDAWRSRDVQKNLYNHYFVDFRQKNPDWSDEQVHAQAGTYISYPHDPARIPPHTTGGAVDLTVVDAHGNELDFGTPFDFFGPEAATLYYKDNHIDCDAAHNRAWFLEILTRHDFTNYKNEWWHFDFKNQIWAYKLGRPFAFYGEVTDPLSFNQNMNLLTGS